MGPVLARDNAVRFAWANVWISSPNYFTLAKGKTMKQYLALCLLLAVGLIAGCKTESELALQAEAKISKADAQATAMAKVPNGTVKEGELERENGRLIWSIELNTPNTKDITEVNVDAITGEIVNIE